MKLSSHWKDKILVREQLNRHDKGLPPKGKSATFIVKWDHPDHPKGERRETLRDTRRSQGIRSMGGQDI